MNEHAAAFNLDDLLDKPAEPFPAILPSAATDLAPLPAKPSGPIIPQPVSPGIEPNAYRAIMQAARIGPSHVVVCPRHGRKAKRYSDKGLHQGSSRALRLALFMLWETGCRFDQMKSARWQDVDFAKGIVVTGHDHVIRLSERLLRFLRFRHRLLQPKPDDLICVSGRGSPWSNSTFGRILRRRANEAGVRIEHAAYLRVDSAAVNVEKGAMS